ncbi:MAG TPA: YeeE/YedE thiosulfate transporter family protein [Gemmatimonadaceae bacterium]
MTSRPYSNPYLSGFGLGLVLLSAFVIAGRGLGASGAFASAATAVASVASPDAARANDYFARYLSASGSPAIDWLVIEIVGVLIGGFISAYLAGRIRRTVEKGPRISNRSRIALAFAGGSAMGLGAVLARGCTSGQALTGGAMLSVGSWLFIAAAFAAAYLAAPLLRRAWT